MLQSMEQKKKKKIRGTKGTFHAKMGLIKDRNGMDLTVAQDIMKRWQEYCTKEVQYRTVLLYRRTVQKKKIFMTKIITMV